jgi:chaperonin GroES
MIEALYNAVVVKPVEVEETMYGNIVIPDLGNETNKTGQVVAVGPGHMIAGGTFVETQLSEGDVVVLPTMGFTKFEYEGDEYWIGKENEVLAKIKKSVNVEEILEKTELTEEDKKALTNE